VTGREVRNPPWFLRCALSEMVYSSRLPGLIALLGLATSVWAFLSSFSVSVSLLLIFCLALTVMGYGYDWQWSTYQIACDICFGGGGLFQGTPAFTSLVLKQSLVGFSFFHGEHW